MKIYCLFSIDNDYNQPPNNLVCFWKEKPSLERLGKILCNGFPAASDENTLKIVKIWQGESQRIGNTDYWLNEREEGRALDE